MREIVLTNQYKKDLKLARRRHLDEGELDRVILALANDRPLPPNKRDHALTGQYRGFRECHVLPDWLLVYSKEEDGVLGILNLVRTDTHADLF